MLAGGAPLRIREEGLQFFGDAGDLAMRSLGSGSPMTNANLAHKMCFFE